MKKILFILLIVSNLFSFSTTNVQVLYGEFDDNSYIFDTKKGGKTTITIEHFRTFDYGEVFMFIDYAVADDRFKYHDSRTNLYGEFSPRFSLSKISSQDLSFLFVKDIFISSQYNGSNDDFNAYLYGFGVDLKIPYFDVFGINIYKKNQNIGEHCYQLSLNYKSKKFYDLFYIDGFTDWTEYDFLSQNQLLFETPEIVKMKDLYFGVEWHYYRQKALELNYDTRINSNTLQGIVKYVW